jgi:PAS domain S-box-containing protein
MVVPRASAAPACNTFRLEPRICLIYDHGLPAGRSRRILRRRRRIGKGDLVDGKLLVGLKRYGVAVALPGLAVALRSVLPFPEGAGIYQLPLAAVVLSAWYGGRGPGYLASVLSIIGAMYLLPPAGSFAVHADHALPLAIFAVLCLLLTEFSAGRRRVEHVARATEERFRTLVQFSFDVYWESDTQHRFTRQVFSERLADAPAPGSEIGKTRWEIPYVEPDEEAWRKHRATLDAHLPFRDFELARPTPDGGTRYVSVSGMPVFDEYGQFIGYRGVGRHINERKRAEAERRAHIWFLESMDRINRAMQETTDLEKMMGDVLDAVLEIFGSDRAWLLYPCDPDAPSWRAVMERTSAQFPGAAARGRELPVSRDAAEVARAALGSRGSLPAGPGHERQVKPEIGEHFGVQSEILMALQPQGDRPYLFGLHQCARPRLWTKEEQRLFEEIGHRLTDALASLIAIRSLRESEARLEAAQRVAHVGWWERDYATTHVSLSDEACRIFGVQPVDLPHWHGRWLSLIHPDDRQKAAEASERALRGEVRYDVEYRVVRPDSTERVVHSQGDVTRDEAGRALRQFGVLQDITELRQAEQELRASEARFRTFVDHATDAFFLHDQNLTLVDVNRQACESLGYTREELIGMHPREFDAALNEASIAQLARRVGEGETVTFETLHRRKNGIVFPVEIRARNFDTRERRFHLSFARDISERKLAEESMRAKDNALQIARTELARVSRLTTLGELTASIAHEVNQPIGAMATNAAACARWLAAKPPDMAEAQAALANIVADGKRAGEVIARIRALTKRQAPRMEPLDVNRKVREVLALAEHELKIHDIVIRADLAPQLPSVAGDRVQLQQVLLNLIVNAIEAMSGVHDRARELNIVTAAKDAGAVVVEVRDSGPGLDEEDTERLFEPFYTTKGEGIGIGLSISRSIVEAHGGRLWATSNEPYGAVFRFSLPVAREGTA